MTHANARLQIIRLRAGYAEVHEEAMRRINAGDSDNLGDLQAREIAIDRELRALGTSLSEVMTRRAER